MALSWGFSVLLSLLGLGILSMLSIIVWFIGYRPVAQFYQNLFAVLYGSGQYSKSILQEIRFIPTNNSTYPWACPKCFKWVKEPLKHKCDT